ncbi:MAG TPA: hypothetical protein VHV55_26650 [Pirellulales bacterium]|jgi:hypothetical protein|nr:hypothetical protein [Pirellulales bacterium]
MIGSLPHLALKSFGFLEAAYGFRLVLSSETVVRWASSDVFVQVCYDACRSYEVGLDIGQLALNLAQPGPAYSLGEVLGVAGFPIAERPFYQASTEERLKLAIEAISGLLARYGQPLLRNDAGAFSAIAAQRRNNCLAYAEERNSKRIRAAVEKAWRAHDYRAVIELYRDQIEHLSPAETRRYEIALKRAGPLAP